MASLEPSVALYTCETALRELMAHAYATSYGPGWLTRVTSQKQRDSWTERAETEAKVRVPKGVAAVPNTGLAYANFYDLVTIAEKHWEPLAPALGRLKAVLPLLQRFDDLRNTIGHSRPLLAFEQDLMSGIAGQIRNQVTLHMSAQDDAGDIYPRIESITDSFGLRIESEVVRGEVAGTQGATELVLHPGDVVTFTCIGTDPQGRELEWDLAGPDHFRLRERVVARSGEPTLLTWVVEDGDVRENASVSIHMRAKDAKYRRFGSFDHRAHFFYSVRPAA